MANAEALVSLLGNLVSREGISVEEAARLLGIAKGTAYRAVRAGQLPAIRIGRRWIVPRRALDAMLSGKAPLPQPS